MRPTEAEGEEAAPGVAEAGAAPPTHLLVYLNDETFTDAGGQTAAMVRAAVWQRLPLVLVHEMDSAKGARRRLEPHSPSLRAPAALLCPPLLSRPHRRVRLPSLL